MFYDKERKHFVLALVTFTYTIFLPLWFFFMWFVSELWGGFRPSNPDGIFHRFGYLFGEPNVVHFGVVVVLVILCIVGIGLMLLGGLFALGISTVSSNEKFVLYRIEDNDEDFFLRWFELKYPEASEKIRYNPNLSYAAIMKRLTDVYGVELKVDEGLGHAKLRRAIKKNPHKLDFLIL